MALISSADHSIKSVESPIGLAKNLPIINEQGSDVDAQEPGHRQSKKRKLNAELLKQFKKHLLNTDLFARLKEIMGEIGCEL